MSPELPCAFLSRGKISGSRLTDGSFLQKRTSLHFERRWLKTEVYFARRIHPVRSLCLYARETRVVSDERRKSRESKETQFNTASTSKALNVLITRAERARWHTHVRVFLLSCEIICAFLTVGCEVGSQCEWTQGVAFIDLAATTSRSALIPPCQIKFCHPVSEAEL